MSLRRFSTPFVRLLCTCWHLLGVGSHVTIDVVSYSTTQTETNNHRARHQSLLFPMSRLRCIRLSRQRRQLWAIGCTNFQWIRLAGSPHAIVRGFVRGTCAVSDRNNSFVRLIAFIRFVVRKLFCILNAAAHRRPYIRSSRPDRDDRVQPEHEHAIGR